MKLGTEVGLSLGHIVLDEDPALPPPEEHIPNFGLMSVVAGWIKIPLGREVGVSPDDIVLDGGLSCPLKRGTAPLFGRCLLWPYGRPSQLLLSTCQKS